MSEALMAAFMITGIVLIVGAIIVFLILCWHADKVFPPPGEL